jgi:hypothetical protein
MTAGRIREYGMVMTTMVRKGENKVGFDVIDVRAREIQRGVR